MGFSLQQFITGKKTSDAYDGLDDIIGYTLKIIRDQDTIPGILGIYKQAKSEPSEKKVNSYIVIYFSLEDFILNNKPPIITQTYTREHLRREIRTNCKIDLLPEKFRLIFVPENEQLLFLFTQYTKSLAEYIGSQTGTSELDTLLMQISLNSIKIASAPAPLFIDFSTITEHISDIIPKDLTTFFLELNTLLYNDIQAKFGGTVADDVTKKMYSQIKEYYSYDLISKFLKIIPQGLLDKERITYMTREDLENQAYKEAEENIKNEQQMQRTVTQNARIETQKMQADTQEQKLVTDSEKMAQKTKMELDTIVATLTEGLILVDANFNITLINNGAKELLGLPEIALVGKNVFDNFTVFQKNFPLLKENHPVYRALKSQSPIRQAGADGLSIRSANGKSIPVVIHVSPFFDNNQSRLTGCVAVFSKATDTQIVSPEQPSSTSARNTQEMADLQKEKEELKNAVATAHDSYLQAQANEAKLLASIRSLPMGFILTDRSDNVVAINNEAKNLLSLQAEALTVTDVDQHLKSTPDLASQIVQARISNRPIDIAQVDVGDRSFHIIVTPVSLSHEESSYLGSVLLIADITTSKMYERNELLIIATHQIRAPISAIQGYLSLLLTHYTDKIADPDVKKILENMASAAGNLHKVVNDFLSVSRLEKGAIDVTITDFDITAVIKDLIAVYAPKVSDKHLQLVFTPEDGQKQIHADREKTTEVLSLIMDNAVKFTSQGTITISIAAKDGYIITNITDTGIGISTQNRELLFRKFQLTHENFLTRDENTGTGLSLFICKKIAEQMKGVIECTWSEENKGSTFSLTLPVS